MVLKLLLTVSPGMTWADGISNSYPFEPCIAGLRRRLCKGASQMLGTVPTVLEEMTHTQCAMTHMLIAGCRMSIGQHCRQVGCNRALLLMRVIISFHPMHAAHEGHILAQVLTCILQIQRGLAQGTLHSHLNILLSAEGQGVHSCCRLGLSVWHAVKNQRTAQGYPGTKLRMHTQMAILIQRCQASSMRHALYSNVLAAC